MTLRRAGRRRPARHCGARRCGRRARAPRPSCARPAGWSSSVSFLISAISSRITGASSTDMPAVGSSNMKMSGSIASSSATSSLRWSPCGRAAAGRCGDGGSRVASRCARALLRQFGKADAPRSEVRARALPAPARRGARSPARDSLGNRLVSWKARPMPALARAEGDSRVMSVSPLKMRPSVGFDWPETRLNHVVLPAPFGPTIDRQLAGLEAQVTSLTAAWPPKRIVRFSVRRGGSWQSGMPAPSTARRYPLPASRGGTDCRGRHSAPPSRGGAASMVEGAPAPAVLFLVVAADRDVHLLGLDLANQFGDRPLRRRHRP